MKPSRSGTLIRAGLFFLAALAFITLANIFGPPPGNIPIFQILAVTVALLFFGKAVSLLLIGNDRLPKSTISSGLIQYYAIVVLTALSFGSLCGYFFIEGVPFHDNASFYSLFHDNLQSLNYFGSPAWWFPHNQFGFPGYFYSILGNMNCLSPVFVSLSFIFWMLGKLGVYITNIMPLYIWYFGAIVPFLFSLSIWFLARQILTSSTALIFVAILSAFSPGVILNFGDLGLLEATAYGLFLAAAYVRFIDRPVRNSFFALVLALLIFAVTINYTLIIWNLLFLIMLFVVTVIPQHSRTKWLTAFRYVSKKKWATVVVLILICMVPSLLTLSQIGDIVRTTHEDNENKYRYLNHSPGNPLEPLLAGTPGVGTMGKNTGKGPYVMYPIVLGSGYMCYTYLGLLVIPLSIIGLLYGRQEWKIRLLMLIIVFYGVVLLSNYSPLFLVILNLDTLLSKNSHFSDALYRSGAFTLLIIAAGMGLDALQKRSELYKKTIGLFVLSVSMSCVLHLYLSHDNPIILGFILGFTIIMALSFLIVLVWLMKGQEPVYKNVIIGLFLLFVLCDVSTLAHLHVRTVMHPAFPRTGLANLDAQNTDKIGLVHKRANAATDTTIAQRSYMKLQKIGLPFDELPKYALFTSGYIAKEITRHDFENAVMSRSLALDGQYLRTGLKQFINRTYGSEGAKNDETIILGKKTYASTELKVRADEPSLLFVRDGYHPYWSAEVNGKHTELFRAMGNFKAIVVPKGESMIRLEFRPPGVYISIAMAYFTILLIAVLLFYETTRSRHQHMNIVGL